MLFNTKQSTRARSAIGYWLLALFFIPVVAYAIDPGVGALAMASMHLLSVVGWFACIAWDVKTLGDDLGESATKWTYPFLSLFSALGVLAYLWDRERQLKATAEA